MSDESNEGVGDPIDPSNVSAENDGDASSPVPGEDETEPVKMSKLKKLMLRGSLIEMSAYGLAQVLRLGSNLLLTRLLVPEAFGLMTTVSTFNIGLILLSDVGIEQSVIHNKDGEKKWFLNTAWTMQVFRGFGLYALALLLAWPLATVENEAQLLWLIPVGSLTVVFAGLGSTREFVLRRKVLVGKILTLDLATQAVSLSVMLTWAWFSPTIWALIAGNLAAEMFRSIGTHVYFPGDFKNRFTMDPKAKAEIIKFGRWILGSSAVFFFASYTDRLFLLPFIGAATLGVYSIAVLLSEAAFMVIGKVIHGVLFPVFARVHEQGIDQLRQMYYDARLRLDALSMTAVGGLALLGPRVVHTLWDDRYVDAEWMLQVLCIRAATRALFAPANTCLMAMGLPKFGFANNLARTIWLFVGIPLGYHYAGVVGIVWAVALSDIPSVFILWPALHRRKMLRLEREAIALVFFAFGAGLGFSVEFVMTALGW